MGRRSSVGVATRYGTDGSGIESRTRPDRLWSPPSLLYNGYRVSFPGVKRPGRGDEHTPYRIYIKERVELHLYSLCAFTACSRVTCTFTFTFSCLQMIRRHSQCQLLVTVCLYLHNTAWHTSLLSRLQLLLCSLRGKRGGSRHSWPPSTVAMVTGCHSQRQKTTGARC